jgi:transposase-like protein
MEPEMPRTRRNFSPAQKVNILREHLIERVPISDLCEKHQIQPTLFYQWQNRTLAQIAQDRLHPPGHTFESRSSQTPHRHLCEHYNTVRLHSAIGYITPESKLLGYELAIFAQRDQKLAMARHQRKIKRQNQPALSLAP